MTITHLEALQKGVVRRCSADDYTQQLLVEFTDPTAVVDRFAPTVLKRVTGYMRAVDIARRLVLSACLIISFLWVLSWFPGDLARERNTAIFYDQQRHRDCYTQYLEHSCDESDDTAICVELSACLATPDESYSQVTVLRFFWQLLDAFFYPLSSKSAVFLGILAGILLYRDLRHQ
jgi:hypothetical protein